MKSLLLYIMLFKSFAGGSQNVLTPSANSFEKKWVKNANYQMSWYMLKDTAKTEIGMVTTRIMVDKTTLTAITEVGINNMKTPWVDSTIAHLSTLEPLRHASHNMQRDMVLNFGKIVTGFYHDNIKQKNTIINDTTNSAYFDSNLYPLLIGWLPLSNGYTQDISIYDFNPAAKIGVLKASVKEVQSGNYASDKNGIRNVWIVTVTDEIGNGENGESTYYFDKTDRKLWKQEIHVNGVNMMMRRIE
jgi:hypothetical protein